MAEFLLVQHEKINKKINKSKYIKIINTIILKIILLEYINCFSMLCKYIMKTVIKMLLYIKTFINIYKLMYMMYR